MRRRRPCLDGRVEGVEHLDRVDLDAQRLERAFGGMAARTPRCRRDRRDHDLREAVGRLDRACRDDGLGDADREALVAVLAQHTSKCHLVVAVDHVRCAPRLRAVHPHVDGGGETVREPTLVAVELRRADAEVEQGA
jgi:hypothetical protein